jgi:hypothetical protein
MLKCSKSWFRGTFTGHQHECFSTRDFLQIFPHRRRTGATFALAAEALVGFLPWPEMRFLTTKMTKIF